ncbi:mitochondrial chaperone bcs1 [Cordyceps militaris CM01]|uniref:Mitochondrial chaperone bcs1 n=1 Tax=Cordyceps militaris (strain CM01) TaxID=983644 RepID=G3JNZ4_CORMM|nr:mitochondrial chaperone bcs1 [Cordyceps militaris CM01]EGX89604.1 mitochondrial chaperone bcs1 [Cordyceps militaris CM01]
MASMMESLSMHFSPLFQQNHTLTDTAAASNNTTTTYAGTFPPGIMDTLFTTAGSVSPLGQLLPFAYNLVGKQFGIDPSLLLTAAGLFWAASKLFKQVYYYLATLVDQFLMCSMHVSEDDHIYDYVMKFLAKHKSIKSNRHLTAQTVYRSAWDDDDDEDEDGDNSTKALFLTNGGAGGASQHQYLNFSNQAATSAPRYIPAMGRTTIWHKGTYFKVNRFKESYSNSRGWGAPMKDVESVQISCYGRSTAPVKELLSEAKKLYYQDMAQKTTIYRPRSKEQRRDYNMWQQVARRPVRPIRTVVLDNKEMHKVLADVNEYLHPATPRWYASRGIPLRRGYLFHGPPGTGKTSFSFALAGVFGIDIYVISLQDISITEEDLAVLFTKLPRRCVILLEDIDSAGLRREGAQDKDEDKTDKEKTKEKKKEAKDADSSSSDSDSDSSSSEEDVKSKKKKRRRRGAGGAGRSEKRSSKKGISLSGLLNAIDGVASHEGRVLIMTTNKPESLDEALVRPGRVDVQVGFAHATPFQVAELFQRMYEPPGAATKAAGPAAAAQTKKQQPAAGKSDWLLQQQAALAYEVDVEADEMRAFATQFASCIPQGKFSPAEVQGFLLKRKKSPRKALEEVQAWVEASLKQKETKSKVVTVQ